MKINQKVRTKEEFKPLYRKGDRFKIIKINQDEGLTPIEAFRLKDGKCYGFELNELE